MRNFRNLIGLEQWYFSLIFLHVNTTYNNSKLSQISLAKRLVKLHITILKYQSLVVFMPNITSNHTITYTNKVI